MRLGLHTSEEAGKSRNRVWAVSEMALTGALGPGAIAEVRCRG